MIYLLIGGRHDGGERTHVYIEHADRPGFCSMCGEPGTREGL